jgi:hypothetical protein
MLSETTKPTLISPEDARIKQKNSVASRLRNQDDLRRIFSDLLARAGLSEAFSILLANARHSDLRRSLPLLSDRIKKEQEIKEYKRAKSREWAARNPQKILDKRLKYRGKYYKEYYKKNKDKIKLNARRYKEKFREKESARTKGYYQRNREDIKEYGRQYYRKNVDKAKNRYATKRIEIIEKSKEYYSKNKDEILLAQRIGRVIRNRSKMAEDLKSAISAIKSAIKQQPTADGLKT